jgi:hypothetical protein
MAKTPENASSSATGENTPSVSDAPISPATLSALKYFARPFDVVSSHPGDSKKQADARAFLHQLMTDNPAGTPWKLKSEYRLECKERFGTPGREFDRLWCEEVSITGATAYRKRGPRGPRGRCE